MAFSMFSWDEGVDGLFIPLSWIFIIKKKKKKKQSAVERSLILVQRLVPLNSAIVFSYKLVKWFGQLLLLRYLCMNRVRWGCPISSYTILEYKANACWPTKSAHLFLSLFLVIQTPKRILCVHTLHDLDSKHVWEQIHGATNSTSINVRRSWVTSRLHHHGIAPVVSPNLHSLFL